MLWDGGDSGAGREAINVRCIIRLTSIGVRRYDASNAVVIFISRARNATTVLDFDVNDGRDSSTACFFLFRCRYRSRRHLR